MEITRDQEWVFVSLAGSQNGVPRGVAVLRRAEAGRYVLDHQVPLPASPTELVLTHDGRWLVAAAGDDVLVLDVDQVTRAGGFLDFGTPLVARFSAGPGAGSVNVNVTPDDRTLFVSNEGNATITVVDLDFIRAKGFGPAAILGAIPVGNAPIALVFSPDGRWLYTTSEVARRTWGWPATLKPEGGDDSRRQVPEGALVVVDVARARADAPGSVVARVPAGGSPVRLALSPDGNRAYVSARNSNAVLVFDTSKLRTDPGHAKVATIPVGPSPVPIAVVAGGRRVVVGNSNRFAADAETGSTLTVLDADRVGDPVHGVVATLPAGAFPREFRLSPDGKTLFLSNFLSHSVQVMDVEKIFGK
jgi:DNA-binding beta-propeller fold protein YncE